MGVSIGGCSTRTVTTVRGKTVYNKFGEFSNACEKAGVPHDKKPQKKEKEEITCLQCGRVREVYPYRAENFENNTSETCKHCMDKKKTVSCAWCGERIVRHNYLVAQHENNFCSKECSGEWRSENIVGENHPRYKGGTVLKMCRNWSPIREDVIERDSKQCVDCGMTRDEHIDTFNMDLHVHHIVPRREFVADTNQSIDDANEMDNLETLCATCHRKNEVKN